MMERYIDAAASMRYNKDATKTVFNIL